MLKKVIIVFFLLLVFFIILTFERKNGSGSANFTSDPTGAEIWIDGSNTGKVTPAKIVGLKDGKHVYSLKKEGKEIFNGTFYIKDNTMQRSPGNGLNDEFHLHMCDDCHLYNISYNSNVSIKLEPPQDLVCHNILIGEHSEGKNCEYCHTNSTQFTPHVGEGICLDCHGD